jgi:hypothetical protein
MNNKNALFALDNLWEGLVSLINRYPGIDFFFGKMTIYSKYKPAARSLLLWFLDSYFRDNVNLAIPRCPVSFDHQIADGIPFRGNDLTHDLKLLIKELKNINENIPPMIKGYINLSDKIIITGTMLNQYFGNVCETGIIIRISDIYPEKLARYVGKTKVKVCLLSA